MSSNLTLTQLSNTRLSKYTTINTLTGEIVNNQIIEDQLKTIMNLVNETGASFLVDCWSEGTLDCLKKKTNQAGEKLPSTANAAADKLGLRPIMPKVYMPSRVERFIKSLTISQLRSQVNRREAYKSLLNDDNETSYATELVKNVQRATENYLKENDTLPANYTDFCVPRFPENILRMGSVDRQYAYGDYDQEEHSYSMSMNVNKVWYSLIFALPDHLRALSITKVCLPNIRLRDDVFHFDTCVEHSIPNPVLAIQENVAYHKPLTVLGVDLGHTNTAVCSIVSSDTKGNLTYHEHSYSYDDLGQRAKLDTLSSLGYDIRTKKRAYEALNAHADKAQSLSRENHHVESRRANLAKDLAYDLAHYVLELCKIFKVDAVSLEDLRFTSSTMKSPSKALNIANSTWSHSQIASIMAQVLNKHGILVLHVNARNTSKSCPSCDTELERSNYHVTQCECGINMDRDQASSISIAKRGILNLLNQSKLPVNIAKNRPRLLKIPVVGLNLVKPSRDKAAPTPCQVNKKHSSRRKYPLKPKHNHPYFPLSQCRNGVICSETTVLLSNRITVVNSTKNIIVENLVIIQ